MAVYDRTQARGQETSWFLDRIQSWTFPVGQDFFPKITRIPLLVEISLKMGQQKYVHHPRRFPIRKISSVDRRLSQP